MERKLFTSNEAKNIYLLAFRRFFAKMVDLFFAQLLSTLFFIFSGLFWLYYQDIKLFYIYFGFSFGIFLYIYENISFIIFGNTIGKKVLGIKIFKQNGEKLNFFEKIKRVFLSNLFGVFFYIGPFIFIFGIFQFIKFVKTGNTSYDKKYLIKYEKLGIFRKFLSFFALLFFTFSFTYALINGFIHYNKENYFIKLKKDFESKEQFSNTNYTLYPPKVEKKDGKIFVIFNYKFHFSKEYIKTEILKSFKEERLKEQKNIIEKSNDKENLIKGYSYYIDYDVYFENNFFDKNGDLIYKDFETPDDFSKMLKSL